jgi:hypothetical protein
VTVLRLDASVGGLRDSRRNSGRDQSPIESGVVQTAAPGQLNCPPGRVPVPQGVSSLNGKGSLEVAATRVCDAIRRHAATCQDEPENVAAVIQAGEALSKAVLEYEEVLRSTSGWSNPIRHLGPLPLFRESATPVADSDTTPHEDHTVPTRSEVAARYRLSVDDPDALLAFASGRFGVDVSNLSDAVRALYEAESWDPEQYPRGLIRVEDAHVEIVVHPGSSA